MTDDELRAKLKAQRTELAASVSDLTAQIAEHLRTGAAIRLPGVKKALDVEEAQKTLATTKTFLHVLQPGSTVSWSTDGTTLTFEAEDGTALHIRPDGDDFRILVEEPDEDMKECDEDMRGIADTILGQLFTKQLKPRQG